MLTRASTNAYSWWWASHIRTKQSKWLDQNLQDMEEKVEYILKIITEDGDSFRVRAEQYYQKRPEIVNFVEDTFREYRALAERYDHLSKDLQSANRTIAIIFPERVQMSIDEEDDEGFALSTEENDNKHRSPLPLPLSLLEAPKLNHPPKMENAVQAMLNKKKVPKKMMSKKGLIKIGVDEKAPVKSSGLSKDEALQEIDKLQKEILGFQTEKEFVKSSFENAITKFWEIESSITEMHAKISNLQDEFEVGTVIEDTDAQTLMASSALKMCGETLDNLKHKQTRVKKEATVEHKRVNDIRKKFEALIVSNNDNSNSNLEQTGEHVKDKTAKIEEKQQNMENGDGNGEEGLVERQPTFNFDRKEGETVEDRKARIKDEILGKNEPITISKVAEKIEHLVDIVINLEIDLASQTALVMRLRFENDELHEQLHSLEQENKNLVDDSNEMKMKIKRLEEQLERVQSLDQKAKGQNVQLETTFNEASVNLDHTSSELSTAEPDENPSEDDTVLQEETERDDETSEIEEDYESVEEANEEKDDFEEENDSVEKANEDEDDFKEENDALKKDKDDFEEENDSVKKANEDKDDFEGFVVKSNEDNDDFEDSVTKPNEDSDEIEGSVKKQDMETEGGQDPSSTKRLINDVEGDRMGEEDQPNWKRLFSYGIEEREKKLLEEYTSTLRNYKEVKKKLNETEIKNRARLFKTAVQMKMLKNSNDSKDLEISSLYEKLKLFEANIDKNIDVDRKELETVEMDSVDEREELDEVKKGEDSNDKETERIKDDENTEIEVKKQPDSKDGVDDPNEVTDVEDEIRREIDDFRKESLELWLRFSTSYHQINRFQDSTNDLLEELKDTKEGKQKKYEHGLGHVRSSKRHYQHSSSFATDIRPIYRHLQDMLAEVTLWLESSEILEDDLQHRLVSLCDIQNELSDLTNNDSKSEKRPRPLNDYQAAKFQGEVLNMKQENNKVLMELRAACDRVKMLQIQIEETLIKLDEELGKKKRSSYRSKVPFRSFLFGVKLKKKHRPSALLKSMSPSLHRQSSKAQESPKQPKEDSQV
ncbi:hypothetical protein L1887_44428 [Cichorium endivia]|nr:hypothetical protein L1887_44428 [Cichorium endivia]